MRYIWTDSSVALEACRKVSAVTMIGNAVAAYPVPGTASIAAWAVLVVPS